MEVKIRLSLTADSGELSAISVCYPSRKVEIDSYRGAGFTGGCGSFGWTAAVQALTALLLRRRLGFAAPQLSGGRGSAAAALDYGVSREPRWLLEMFGTDSEGRSLLRRYLHSVNPNLKRPGPVELTLGTQVSVEVEAQGVPVCQPSVLQNYLDRIERNWRPYGERLSVRAGRKGGRAAELSASVAVAAPAAPALPGKVIEIFKAEIERSLAEDYIFDRQASAERLRSMAGHPLFTRVSGKGRAELAAIEADIPPASRLGLSNQDFLRRHLCCDRPVKVAAAVNSAGANTIFWYLKKVKDYNLEIDNHFAHALEIGNRIIAADPVIDHDLCVIANAPAATLLARKNRHEYSPMMLMPTSSQRVVAARTAGLRLDRGSFHYLLEAPSTAMFYFDRLSRNGKISRNSVQSLHREPHETACDLESGDPDVRAILFFPYCQLNEFYNNCRIIDSAGLPDQNPEMILFAHRSFSSDRVRRQALQIAVRDAWYELNRDPAARAAAAAAYLEDCNFKRILGRCSGIRAVDAA